MSYHELEAIVREATSSHGEAGFSAAVLHGRKVVKVATGLANPELEIRMTADTLVQIGSTTKLFNAAVVMKLVEQGRLDLDQPVSEVLDSFQLADDVATKTITLRHLLSMSSGMDGGPFDDHGAEEGNLARHIATIADLPHLFPPGGGYAYSNAGVMVAGLAAEVAMGQRWDELLRELILFPAGLSKTETVVTDMLFHPVAVGLDADGEVVRPWCMSHSMNPAGGSAAATADDLVRFAALFLNEGRSVDGAQVLAPETVAAMVEPVVDVATGFPFEQWGLGVGKTTTGTHAVYGHPGFNTSGCSVLWWVPGLDVAVASATNAPSAFPALLKIARQVLSRLGCEPPVDPQPLPEEVVEGMEAYVGIYDTLLFRYEIGLDDHGVTIRGIGKEMLSGHEVDTRLVPAGRGRFLPAEPLLPGFDAPTAIAFGDYAGVKILLNGNGAAPMVTPERPSP